MAEFPLYKADMWPRGFSTYMLIMSKEKLKKSEIFTNMNGLPDIQMSTSAFFKKSTKVLFKKNAVDTCCSKKASLPFITVKMKCHGGDASARLAILSVCLSAC